MPCYFDYERATEESAREGFFKVTMRILPVSVVIMVKKKKSRYICVCNNKLRTKKVESCGE